MVVVEYKDDDYGKIMEYVSCILKKAQMIQDILEEDTMVQRSPKKYNYDTDDDYRQKRYISRYV